MGVPACYVMRLSASVEGAPNAGTRAGVLGGL
jgi:hypothetical protein